MLDNFLVVLEDNFDALIPYAVSVAKSLGARATAVFPRRDPTGLEDGSLEARLETAAGAGPARKARAQTALQAFARAAEAESVEAETLYPEVGQDPPRDVLPRFARAFDFALVQQRAPGTAPTRDDLVAVLLAESGRPVWVTPAIHRAPAAARRILVAWDGGAAAARAFSEAKPMLMKAERVEIVTVVGGSTPNAVLQGGARLAQRLMRAGVAAEFRRLPSGGDPATLILSYAADVSADLLVCGGYSHSPLRESLFGGATRTLLTSLTLPTLFAH